MGAVTSKMKVLLHIREGANVEEYTYAVGTAEERRSFVVSCLRHAEHMDEQGIVKELIPGMMSMLAFSDCCLTIASVLPDFMRHASMERKDVFVYFMGLIMSLSSSSDLAVVQRISVSLRKIIQCAGDDVFEELLFPFVVSMIMSQWSSPRAVAASLMAVVAARRHASRATGWTVKQCFSRFTELTQDSCTFVRQVCAECMHDWVMVAKLRRMNIVQMPLSVVRKCIINDESDAVRYTYVAELVPLADKVGKEATSRHLLSLYIKASKDASWRVRYYAAKNLFAFTQLCAEPSSLLDVFVRLCEDEVKEVRVVIVDQLEAFSPDKGEVEVFTKACAAASLLARDEEPAVRASVAKNLYLLLSPIVMQTYLPEQRETLLGLFTDDNYSVAEGATRNVSRVLETLIAYIRADTAGDAANCAKPSYTLVPQDEHNVHPVVDASCAQGGHAGCTTAGKHTGGCCCGPPEVTTAKDVSEEEPFTGSTKENVGGGEEMLQSSAAYVCAALADRLGYVSESRNWRLREACAHVTRYFCLAFTQQEFVPLLGIVRKLLCDPISAVRARCVDTLAIVASAYGPKMAALVMGELLKKEFEVIEEIPFIMRMMAIRCFSSLAPLIDGLPPDDVQRCELHRRWMMMLIPLAADDVPNVRLLLAKTIATQWEWYRTCSNQDVVRQCVDRLRRDSEVDVIAAMEAVGASECA
uniref:Protein phosphatase 2A regulatory subunit n=1 Tax=Trypanosoma congolense (strain IL3000) TaxID=1068625 RepID=G0UTV2_TRYCI|nr:putative protein phosphatase 2A regulatory subunit [Trypanosoma congolense IL3000]